jgi:hypothetical protein
MISELCSFFFKPLFFVVLGIHCGIYKSSYTVSNISYLNYLPPSFCFISPSPIPGIVSAGLIFPFKYICTQYLHYINLLIPFPHILSLPLVPLPPGPVPPSCQNCVLYFMNNTCRKSLEIGV